MSDLQRRPTRAVRERRAYQATIAGGTAALVAAVSFVLAIVGIGSFSITFLALLVAAACFVLFRRSTGT